MDEISNINTTIL